MADSTNVVNNVLKNEGGFSNVTSDLGGPTAFGISKAANPEAWKNGPPTEEQARAIYELKYIKSPGFDKITDFQLQSQLVDWGVNSGPSVAIQALQRIVGAAVDGVLGPETLAAIQKMHADDINNHLVMERVKMIGRIISANPSQAKFASGWLNRAVEFLK